MSKVPHTAMVLAAGMGSRMRPLTETTPKPLLEVCGKKLIDYLLDPLAEAGVKRVVVNVHWLADQVEAHMATRHDFEVVISDERGERLETGGGLAKARPLLGDDPVFVVNTDAFWSPASVQPLLDLVERFEAARPDVMLLAARTDQSLGFHGAGDFFPTKTGGLTFRGDADKAPLAFAGVRIIRPQLYDNEAIRAFSAVEVWKRSKIMFTPLDAFWLHVGDPDALKDAEMWLKCHGG
jgi:MurNAc alpha-1-phosphate uridylyltransferase